MGAELTGTGLGLAGSTMFRVFGRDTRLPMAVEDVVQAATVAEETGYASVWVPDHGVWDPFALLAALAPRTSSIGLATGVVTVGSREPTIMAAAATTLDRVSGGRAILGIGSGSETRLGRVSEYVSEVRSTVDSGIPVVLAALGPGMVELAGTDAAGVLLNWCTPDRVRRAREELLRHGPAAIEVSEGATAEGEPRLPKVAVYVRACLGHDRDHALEALRPAVALYASIPAYRHQLEREDMGRLAAAAADAHRRDSPGDVPEELVDALCVTGGRDDALARLEEYRAAGADQVVVYPVPAQEPVSSLMGTIMAAGPDPSVEA
jgi:alkanesulfonate monooxygenase SsuD/methylene tetrahydromethanopterin reductase-like flavin-dependent oxidoreductase (luciferase family)